MATHNNENNQTKEIKRISPNKLLKPHMLFIIFTMSLFILGLLIDSLGSFGSIFSLFIIFATISYSPTFFIGVALGLTSLDYKKFLSIAIFGAIAVSVYIHITIISLNPSMDGNITLYFYYAFLNFHSVIFLAHISNMIRIFLAYFWQL